MPDNEAGQPSGKNQGRTEQERTGQERTDQERTAADLAATVSQLMRRLRVASPQGALTPSQRTVLGRLANGGPATTAELARAELVRPQSMRVIVAKLEELELVTRTPHPTDGRQVLFSLTEYGEEAVASVRHSKHAWLADAITHRLSPDEQRALADATRLLQRLVEE
ncbi:MarR family transcriptional regulator [Streptomyces roseoverticillatus]|uniref:MarR family winged helix-turn-helix transcriptional regulator n=1 Tax=Streptomyces roseoverticillatus TaxID=66429 RepID=UPI0027E45739|nr:MarR family transcriptional regulator [Streptomyces roseoverticillatus]MCF3102522.1 MarR family transcriptional regulator [Streptomyces roseoverticillatus]